jgi:hypothetical protein
MMRSLAVISGAVVAMLISSVPYATAAPDDGGQCTFVVSTPQSAALPGPGGAEGVTATLTWTSCTGLATPAYAEVCISTPTSNGRCTKRVGWDSPQAIIPTQNSKGAFTAHARGCYRTPSSVIVVCDTADQSVTL